MKSLLTFIFISISFFSYSQDWYIEKPDYDEIEINIQKEDSNLFYKTLLDRYLKADSTLNWIEKRHLYYGYTFNENYASYFHSTYTDSLRVIFQKEKLGQEDYNQIVVFSDELLKKNPFDLNALDYQLFSLEELGETEEFNKKLIQFGIVIDAILSSGNGTSKEEAFYVIYTSHEYALLNILGFQFGGTQSLIEHYDYLTVAENIAGIEGLYFDVSPCLNSILKIKKD
ncbi:MAG: DUF4919 domain-containing protein [Bacteroidetes bacterium]|jgi:hypothetical protein|nr:DUF4919 domain-containing protein [Bacteroidota bacterium]